MPSSILGTSPSSSSSSSTSLRVEAKEFVPRGSSGMGVQTLSSSPPKVSIEVRQQLLEAVRRQVEFYFSDENLHGDYFMLTHIFNNPEGYFPFQLLCTFNRVSQLTSDVWVIRDAVLKSSILEFSPDGSGVRRQDWANYYEVNNGAMKSGRRKSKKQGNGTGLMRTKSKENLPETRSSNTPKLVNLIKEKEAFVLTRVPRGPDGVSKGFSADYRASRSVKQN